MTIMYRAVSGTLGILLLSLMWACSGGGTPSSQVTLNAGVSGQVCLTLGNSYTITDDATGQSRTIPYEVDPLFSRFRGAMGGQIRAVAPLTIAGGDSSTSLIWGGGASIRVGTGQETKSILPLSRTGVVTDLASLPTPAGDRIFFATEHGIGLASVAADRKLTELPNTYRPLPAGVLAVAVGEPNDGSQIFFVTGDGYLLTTSTSDLEGGGSCFKVLTAPEALVSDGVSYLVSDVEILGDKAFVLASRRKATPNFVANYAQEFASILQSIIEGKQAGIVRAVDMASHGVATMAWEAADESFSLYDQFVPTDIAIDGQEVYVAGLVYDKKAIDRYMVSSCEGNGLEAQLACLLKASADGTLSQLRSEQGVSALAAGFFVFRDMNDLSKPAHFEWIPLTLARYVEGAAPLSFRIAASQGKLYLRAPNFLISMTKGTDPVSGKERWSYGSIIDAERFLVAGLPQQVVFFSSSEGNAIASAVASAPDTDGSGGSSLEIVSADGAYTLADIGSSLTRIEAATPSTVVAIDLFNKIGGMLYLQTTTERTWIVPASPMAIVSQAVYDGTRLAFAWTEAASNANPTPAWRLNAQQGADANTRGEIVVSRQGGSGIYDGFPALTGMSRDEAGRARSIADILLQGSYLFVLYEGFASGQWYDQVGVYSLNTDNKPRLVGLSAAVSVPGTPVFAGGRFVRLTRSGAYTIFFVGVDGLRRMTISPGTPESPSSASIENVFSASTLVDLTCDMTGKNLCAYAGGMTIHLRDLGDPAEDKSVTSVQLGGGASVDRLYGASLAMAGSKLFAVTPVGAAATFSTFDVSDPLTIKLSSSCTTCRFSAVNAFPQLQNIILVSSPTGGIEIYDVSGM